MSVTATVEQPIHADPVISRRAVRVTLASLASVGFAIGVGIPVVGGIALGVGLGYPTIAIACLAVSAGAGLFALPAVYWGVSRALGGNGSYWGAFAGNGLVGATMVGLGFVFANRRPYEIFPVFAFVAPVLVLASMSVGYELTTRATPPAPSRRPALALQIFPGLLLNETQRGLTLGGVF